MFQSGRNFWHAQSKTRSLLPDIFASFRRLQTHKQSRTTLDTFCISMCKSRCWMTYLSCMLASIVRLPSEAGGGSLVPIWPNPPERVEDCSSFSRRPSLRSRFRAFQNTSPSSVTLTSTALQQSRKGRSLGRQDRGQPGEADGVPEQEQPAGGHDCGGVGQAPGGAGVWHPTRGHAPQVALHYRR